MIKRMNKTSVVVGVMKIVIYLYSYNENVQIKPREIYTEREKNRERDFSKNQFFSHEILIIQLYTTNSTITIICRKTLYRNSLFFQSFFIFIFL